MKKSQSTTYYYHSLCDPDKLKLIFTSYFMDVGFGLRNLSNLTVILAMLFKDSHRKKKEISKEDRRKFPKLTL